MFCHVATEQVLGIHDVSSVYHVPLLLQSQGIINFLQKRLNLTSIHLTKEMKERGLLLEQSWKELTTRYVLDSIQLVIRNCNLPLDKSGRSMKSPSCLLESTLICRTHTCPLLKLLSTPRSDVIAS